ncbi:Protein NRT1/PTR FAMILY 8.4 [Forsythia ovata]|uniref:Protein NRT1/PTR FAMILY 8.4 n=1 Tax=Forsythia ovata TaxID=205694 RepID=A0ABD1VLP8_9LAMI
MTTKTCKSISKSYMSANHEVGTDSLGSCGVEEESRVQTLVSNGCVDYKGRIADKQTTGGWKASPFIIVNEVAERLAFFAIAVNMVAYLVREMHQTLPNAATHVTDWIGAAYVLTLLGAFLADAYLGRFRTIIIFSCVYSVGMVLLTLSASIDSLHPPKCTKKPCIPASTSQTAVLYCALALIALGTGGIKPCVSSFGADQFDMSDEKEVVKKYSFFNWFFFAINMGALLGITLLVYIQVEFGWTWGFAIPTVAMFCSILILASGFPKYRYQKPTGSVFTRFFQVVVASLRNHYKGVEVGRGGDLYEVNTRESDIFGARKLAHTEQYRPPKWIGKLGPHFEIPSGSVPVFSAINALILVPVYEILIVPYLRIKTGHPRGITSLQRMGIGLFVSIFALFSAALVEKMRRNHSNPSSLSVFWLFPQCFLIGTAEVFTYVGQLEFFYDEASDGTRSISSALFLSEIGIGSWISTAIVKIIEGATGGEKKGWLRDDLNKSKLDYFYWILTGISGLNFLVYTLVAWKYKGGIDRSVRDESAEELQGKNLQVDDKGELFKSVAF